MADLRIGIDTGGTFTDVAVLERGAITVHKLPSTPADPGLAVIEGVNAVRGGRTVDVVHGTTVGLNAVLTGRLARTALVTNAGFEDLIEIGRQDRLGLYDLEPRRAAPIVPRELRLAVEQRRLADGRLETEPDRAALTRLADRLRALGAESIAIGLLHAAAHPEDELRVAAALAELGLPVTCSAALLPRPGEFERLSAAVLNAAIRPVMSGYLARLEAPLRPGRLRLLRSSGGIMGSQEAIEFPARAMFSGPAGGVIATARIAAARGTDRLAAIDIGGTSTDVALVGREPEVGDDDRGIAGLPLPLPAFDVHTIGCGGGSIAWVDAGGALRVGPHSAGADPGPACYGKGSEPTVTDAHVALGQIRADTLLGGRLSIDPDRAVRAIEVLSRKLGVSPRAAAQGVLEVADVAMVRALLVITSQRAVDPAGVPLLAYGGAGGLHAASLAKRLGMPFALVAPVPGAFSAVGLALAGESRVVTEPVLQRLADLPARVLTGRIRALAERARAELGGSGRAAVRLEIRLRFAGQGAGLWTSFGSSLEERFARLHQQRFGFVASESPIEVVELRAEARRPGPRLEKLVAEAGDGEPSAVATSRPPLGGRSLPVWARETLPLGYGIEGPALIVETTSVIRIPDDWSARVDPTGVVLQPPQGSSRARLASRATTRNRPGRRR